jgi:hypothetical protein
MPRAVATKCSLTLGGLSSGGSLGRGCVSCEY